MPKATLTVWGISAQSNNRNSIEAQSTTNISQTVQISCICSLDSELGFGYVEWVLITVTRCMFGYAFTRCWCSLDLSLFKLDSERTHVVAGLPPPRRLLQQSDCHAAHLAVSFSQSVRQSCVLVVVFATVSC